MDLMTRRHKTAILLQLPQTLLKEATVTMTHHRDTAILLRLDTAHRHGRERAWLHWMLWTERRRIDPQSTLQWNFSSRESQQASLVAVEASWTCFRRRGDQQPDDNGNFLRTVDSGRMHTYALQIVRGRTREASLAFSVLGAYLKIYLIEFGFSTRARVEETKFI
jgi:hypothetical protein